LDGQKAGKTKKEDSLVSMETKGKYEIEVRRVDYPSEYYCWIIVSGFRQIRNVSRRFTTQKSCERKAVLFAKDFSIRCVRRIDGEPSKVLYDPSVRRLNMDTKYVVELEFKNPQGVSVMKNTLLQGDVSEKDEKVVEDAFSKLTLPTQEEGTLDGFLTITKITTLKAEVGKMDLTEALAVEELGIQVMEQLRQYTKKKHGIS